jgi:hypothetical protein
VRWGWSATHTHPQAFYTRDDAVVVVGVVTVGAALALARALHVLLGRVRRVAVAMTRRMRGGVALSEQKHEMVSPCVRAARVRVAPSSPAARSTSSSARRSSRARASCLRGDSIL